MDVGAEVYALRILLSRPELPPANYSVIFEDIVFGVLDPEEAQANLIALASSYTIRDTLYDTYAVSQDRNLAEPLFSAIIDVGYALVKKLHQINAYQRGRLPYDFWDLKLPDTLVLIEYGTFGRA